MFQMRKKGRDLRVRGCGYENGAGISALFPVGCDFWRETSDDTDIWIDRQTKGRKLPRSLLIRSVYQLG
jgi:hypothetical protein